MCQFKQLYSSGTGYVIRCNQCNNLQVLFDGTMLSISEDEFETFLVHVRHHAGKEMPPDPGIKSIVLATPRQGVHLVLSAREFRLLQNMLEEADVERKTLEMLELFAG